MECFPPVCRDKSAGLTERDWTEPRAHSFSYLCHAWWSVGFTNLASRTSSPDPVQFEPPFLHVWVCNCACVCVSEHIHWHPLFQLCRCLILCRDEGVWAGPDLSCRKRCLTCFFFFFFFFLNHILSLSFQIFVRGRSAFWEEIKKIFELRLCSVKSSLFLKLPSQCINSSFRNIESFRTSLWRRLFCLNTCEILCFVSLFLFRSFPLSLLSEMEDYLSLVQSLV